MITLEDRMPSAMALVIAEALEQAIAEATKVLHERIAALEVQVADCAKDLERLETAIPDEVENQIDSALESLSVELTRR